MPRIVDVGFLLSTHRTAGNAEYDALRLVTPGSVREFVACDDPMLAPSARFLLRSWADNCPNAGLPMPIRPPHR